MALVSLSTFIGGGFQMVALKVGSYAFPRERAAMMTGIASGSWSLVNFLLLRAIGPWTGWMNGNQLGGDLLADRRPSRRRHCRVVRPELQRHVPRSLLAGCQQYADSERRFRSLVLWLAVMLAARL